MKRRRFFRVLLAALLAAFVSLAAGIAMTRLIDLLPCQGDILTCNIEDAIGGYGLIVFVPLSALIYSVVLSIACNRTALAGAALLLLTPLILFIGGNMLEIWEDAGLAVYAETRACAVAFLPPLVTVLVQWLILRLTLDRIAGDPGDEPKQRRSRTEPELHG